MSGSMWSCSGKHWLRQTAAWSAFAVVVSVVADAGAEPADPHAAVSAVRLELSSPFVTKGGHVAIDITALDLARLDAAAFGDQEESPPSQ